MTPQEYALLERRAIEVLPIAPEIVAAMQPVEFMRSGFVHRVERVSDLVRYADHLVESSTPNYFRPGFRHPEAGFLPTFTSDEARLVKLARHAAVKVTAELMRPVRPILMPMIAVGALRAVNMLAEAVGIRHNMAVFEIGPGAGYLGPMVNAAAHRYASTDVSQGYALWQRALFEAAGMPTAAWFWWDAMRDGEPRFDLIWANSVLGEMTPRALDIWLGQAAHWLRDSPLAAIAWFNHGNPSQLSPERLGFALGAYGFREERRLEPFHLWRLCDRKALSDMPAILDHYGAGGYRTAMQLYDTPKGAEPLDFDEAFVLAPGRAAS